MANRARFGVTIEEYRVASVPSRHPSLFEPRTLALAVLLAGLGIVIGLELLTRVGITPNTSIIAAVIVIGISRVPHENFAVFRSLPRQNLLQTVISAATFGGANAILLPVGILWLLGAPELVPAMMLGAFLGLSVDATILYKIFDSKVYPADGIWPPGVATAECLIAGDRGGARGRLLGFGAVLGALGRFLGLPMDIVGVCWIGNIWALSMFGLGLLIRGHAREVFGLDISEMYVPHGIMIGAGAVALAQIGTLIVKRDTPSVSGAELGVTGRQLGTALAGGMVGFAAAAALMAALAGLYTMMPLTTLVEFIVFAAVAALVSELIVGIAAMHAGWFPTFATTLIFLVLGMLLRFPSVPLAFLVGFTASTGPAFADMGYDFKTGWLLRGSGKHPEFERQGRRQQYYAALVGFAVAALVVWLSYSNYFSRDLFPPVDRVFVATIQAGAGAATARYLLVWSLPGAIVQAVGGPSRQLGILLATGLLIYNPVAGWTAAVSLAARCLLLRKHGNAIEGPMFVLAGGFIAGSALMSFGTATLNASDNVRHGNSSGIDQGSHAAG